MCVHKWQSNNVQYELSSSVNIKLERTEKRKSQCNPIENRNIIKIRAFWDVAPCSLVVVDGCFGGAYCLLHHGNE
jgi:uncharacterized protein YdeI (YjbR/CyaY-like superfamily)